MAQCIIKYILHQFQISSVGILSIAFIINHKLYKWSNFISTELITTPQILLVIGIGLLIISIIGLCGVLRDIGWLLTLVCIFFKLLCSIFYFLLKYNLHFNSCSFPYCLQSYWSENLFYPVLCTTWAVKSESMRWIRWTIQFLDTIKLDMKPPHKLGIWYRLM